MTIVLALLVFIVNSFTSALADWSLNFNTRKPYSGYWELTTRHIIEYTRTASGAILYNDVVNARVD